MAASFAVIDRARAVLVEFSDRESASDSKQARPTPKASR
jgi:hypothetical protein